MSVLTQSTKGKLKPLIGFGAILFSVLSLFLLDGVLVWLHERGSLSAAAANLIIGSYALVLFAALLYFLSLSCVYTLDGLTLSFSRVYLKNPRLAEQIMLREVVFYGSPEESKNYACARTQRFTARRGNLTTRAVIYQREGKYRRILFSPNAQIDDALREAVRSKQKQ